MDCPETPAYASYAMTYESLGLWHNDRGLVCDIEEADRLGSLLVTRPNLAAFACGYISDRLQTEQENMQVELFGVEAADAWSAAERERTVARMTDLLALNLQEVLEERDIVNWKTAGMFRLALQDMGIIDG